MQGGGKGGGGGDVQPSHSNDSVFELTTFKMVTDPIEIIWHGYLVLRCASLVG